MNIKQQPFKRLHMITALIASIPELTSTNHEERQKQFASIPDYFSRGKGKGLQQKANKHAHMSFVRASRKKHERTKTN